MRTSLLLIPAVASAFALTACAQSNPSVVPPAQSQLLQSRTARPGGSSLRIFTANRNGGDVLAFKVSANGNVAPLVSIGGSNTRLIDPDSLAIDASGRIYTADDGATKVRVFGAAANGNAKPKRTIGGSKSQLGDTEGLAIDSSGNLWVSSYSNNAITEYKAGAKRNVKPIDTISGGNTGLDSPTGMAFDSGGRLYVANTIRSHGRRVCEGCQWQRCAGRHDLGRENRTRAPFRGCVRLERPFTGCR